MTETYEAKDPAGLARMLGIWLWIDVAATALVLASIAVELVVMFALPRDEQGAAIVGSVMMVHATFGLVGVLIYLVVAFLALKWIYRSSRNAHALAGGLTISPPWAIGWFFVPIASLWKPFQAIREAWQASTRPDDWRSVPVPPLLRWWWAVLLIAGVLGTISGRLALKADTAEFYLASNVVDLFSYAADLALDLVFIQLVRRLTQLQVAAIGRAPQASLQGA